METVSAAEQQGLTPSQNVHEVAFEEASKILVGGVNSPVRSFKSVGGTPIFFERGAGASLYDIRGERYLDYVLSWGAMLLGHTHPQVQAALSDALTRGTSFGTPTLLETEMAKQVQQHFPSLEKLRFVNSGTEAVMSLARLARGYTGREKFIKFRGCYHGHADYFLVEAGSGALTLGNPSSSGVTKGAVADSLLATYNDLASVRAWFEKYPNDIAAVLIEPVPGNMGVICPDENFLSELRTLTQEYDALLIFDEVMTGFRVDIGGVQARTGVKPDLTALGKVLGGGLPAALYGGRAEVMDYVAPLGPVYHAGTLSGNPLAMTSGLSTLKTLAENKKTFYDQLETQGAALETGLRAEAKHAGVPVVITRYGAMLTVFFTERTAVRTFEDAKSTNSDYYACFFHAMLAQNIFLPPSPFEAWFLSTEHDDANVEMTLKAARHAFEQVRAMPSR